MTRRTIGWLMLLALRVICGPLAGANPLAERGLAHRLFSVWAATA